MALLTKKRLKYALAVVGAIYAIFFVGYLAFAAMNRVKPKGPSELEAHPERQAEILAEQRAKEMQDRLGLSDAQVKQLADVFKARPQEPPAGPPDRDKMREMMDAQREAMAKVLTPEQQEKLLQMRGPGGPGGPGRPGGPRGRMNPERMQERMKELMSKMTPEQQARMQKHLQRFQERRDRRGDQGPGGQPPDGPPPGGEGGPPPDGEGGPPPGGDGGPPP